MTDRRERLVAYLSKTDGWVTAAELADQLGVSSRSVRTYVTALKSSAQPLEVIASSASGYRLDRERYAEFVALRSLRDLRPSGETPRQRQYHLVRRLGDSPDGLDLHTLAGDLFVSESTIEQDLRKIRPEIEDAGLSLTRTGSTVGVAGTEQNLRRLLSRMFRDEETQGFLELASIEREFASSDLAGFKTALLELLDEAGYYVNEYGVNNVLLHVAITVDRLSSAGAGVRLTGQGAQAAVAATDVAATDDSGARAPGTEAPGSEAPGTDAPGTDAPGTEAPGTEASAIQGRLAALVASHFGVTLEATDASYLASLLTTRVAARPTESGEAPTVGGSRELGLVRDIVARVAEEYLVDLDDDEFVTRLSLHVGNLLARAHDGSFSRNPMTRSLKTTYPMIYEVAVFIASVIQERESIEIGDDEIAYIALHVGAYLERQSRREERISVALVCPNYYDLHLALRTRIEALLGDDLEVEVVITRTDVAWHDLRVDLVLTTITSPTTTDGVVVIHPFLTVSDIESIRRAVARVRRQRRRARLKDDLLVFFDEALFVRNLEAADEADAIRSLGQRMLDAGIIDDDYVTGAIARERMSSTAFTDTLAVPHSLAMTATRTAICIAVNESPMSWGESRVNVVALVAFSASDRSTFQSIFDQFVSVFAERDDVGRIIRNSSDFPSFIEEIVRSMA